MAMEMSFSDDFWTRYAGAETTTTGAAEQEADQAVRRESRELQLEAQRRAARDTDFAESVYSTARAELKSADPGSTPTGVAMNYTADVARMKSYAEAGDLPKAFGVHQQLRANAAANRDIYIDRMHAQPRTPDEQQINQLYMSYVSNAFDGVKLQLKDGWTGTAGELFGDTEEYKKHDIDTLARAGFSAGASAMYRSDDPEKRAVVSFAVDPVVRSMEKNPNPHEYRMQYHQVADHMVAHYDELRDELGADALRQLYSNAVDPAFLKSGTSVDYIDNVLRMVRARMAEYPEGLDMRTEIRKATGAIVRLAKQAAGSADPDESQYRFASMIATSVLEAAPDTDFDAPTTRSAVDALSEVVTEFRSLRVPVLPLAMNGSSPVMRDIAEFVSAASNGEQVPQDNYFVRASTAMGLVDRFLAGGTMQTDKRSARDRRPDAPSSEAFGSTTGSSGLDDARMRIKMSLLGLDVMPGIANDKRPDQVLNEMISDPEGVSRLTNVVADALAVSTGMGDLAAKTVADKAVGTAIAGGGGSLLPLDLRGAIEAIAFDRKSDPMVVSTLNRWMAANGVASRFVQRKDAELMALLTNPIVGHGITDHLAARSVLEARHMEYVELMRSGKDPTPFMEQNARHGNWWVPTGDWILPDGHLVSDAELKSGKYKVKDPSGKERAVSITPAMKLAVFPRFVRESGDLDSANIGSVSLGGAGIVPAVKPGAWTDKTRRQAFLDGQSRIIAAMRSHEKAVNDAAGKALKDLRESDE